jgi:hypothetical protein
MTRHFGVFHFKPEVTQEQIEESFLALVDLKNKIPGLLTVEHGPYQSAEGLNDGFTHGFIMTFETAQHRDDYLPHPDHQLVVDLVQPRLERLVVFDFDI